MKTISVEELREKLRGEDPVEFVYIKKDGTSRKAIGSINEMHIPEDLKSKDPSSNKFGNNLRYFDIEKKFWRALSIDCSTVDLIE